jgi:hypothetical protein
MWHFIIKLVVFGVLKDISAFRMLGTTHATSVTSCEVDHCQVLKFCTMLNFCHETLKSDYLCYFQIVSFHPNLRMAHFLLLEVVEDVHSIQRNLEGVI